MRILAVDDDPMILEMLEAAISVNDQHKITTAPNGERALELIRSGEARFDCFLLDIQMPGIDGIDLCEAIRDMPAYADAPIIMATAMSQKSYIDRAFRAGANDYVIKPFDFRELETRVETAHLVHQRGRTTATAPDGDPARPIGQSLEEPVEVPGVPGLIGYVAFDNYIGTLSVASRLSCSVYAVKIANIRDLYHRSSPSEFRQVLTDLAEVVSAGTKDEDSVFSYRGNGLFLCLRQNAGGPFESRVLESAFTLGVKSRNVNLAGKSPRILVGPATPMRLFNTGGTLRKAVGKVESRLRQAQAMGDMGSRPAEILTKEDADLLRRRDGYSDLLQDFLDDGTGSARSA